MQTIEEIQQRITRALKEIDFRRKPGELYEPISYTLSLGGKRLRPALCLMACDMFGGDVENAINPAIGIEIFHNFTLLHDDIMDEAPIRRGEETVYKKWNTNVAILSGDTMMALAYDYIMKAPESVRSEVFSVFNKTAIEVCEGQQYDMNFETQNDISIKDYIEMIRLKTAVLLAGSLKIGAILAGADAEYGEALYRFGENLGIAFQLKDDLLDVFSDVEKFGKQTGGDIATNKKTFLYLKAFEKAEGETFTRLTHLFDNNSSDKIAEVKKVYEELNIREDAENEMKKYFNRAIDFIEIIPVNENRKSELIKFAQRLNRRES
jgi:geranylgeranyl diphosphate synthase type II